MKTLRIFAALALALPLAAVTAEAQRTRRPAPRPTPRVVTSSTLATPADVKAGSDKVSIQIKNVTKYIFVLGGAATAIEALDKDTRANQAARSANADNKQKLLQSIRDLRAGLAALEAEFGAKPALRKFLPQIRGITDLSGQSQSLAASGRFADSGRPLLSVVEKLSDTLAAM